MNKRLFKIPRSTAWIYPRRIWFCPPDAVALTFDDGPHPEITPWLLDFLKEKNIQATFFWLGEQMEKYPHLMTRAKEEGHIIAFHGQLHIDNKKIDFTDFKKNIQPLETEDYLYRPPYGRITRKQAKYITQKLKRKIVMWSWMAYDFDHSVSIKEILLRANKNIKGGEIIVLHENDKTAERLKILLPDLLSVINRKGLCYKLINHHGLK